jgi:hypothetical protein
MDESIQVSSVIEKLPSSLKDYKHKLKHEKDEMSLTQLGSHLRIEESLRAQDADRTKEPKGKEVMDPTFFNMVEVGEGSNKNKGRFQGAKRPFKPSNSSKSNVGEPTGPCWICGQSGHYKADCRVKRPKKGQPPKKGGSGARQGSKDQGPPKHQGNDLFIENISDGSNSDLNYVPLISEACYVQDDDVAWWIDSGATRHVCKDRSWFEDYQLAKDGTMLFMGNESKAAVEGIGTVVLSFSSGNNVILKNVFHVPLMRKNLVFGSLLSKDGFKQVYESDKYVLSKHGTFVGFGYLCNGMFMLNLQRNDDIMNVVNACSDIAPSDLWHARLGHVHFRCLLLMSKGELIPSFDVTNSACYICQLNKITRQPFPGVKRSSSVLELIHSDLCDFHSTPSIGNKKYVITFIDDSTRYCYIFLVHSKDEAMVKFGEYKTEVELQLSSKIKKMRSDRGGEYYDPTFFSSCGIIHEVTLHIRRNRMVYLRGKTVLSKRWLIPCYLTRV